MFDQFDPIEIATRTPAGGAVIRGRVGGEGRPVLLLHGYPQTGAMWHRLVTRMPGHRFVVPDLRGYGRSSKPKTDERHTPYSKREMALDMVQVMAAMGAERFDIVAHDRGARVAHRLAADHPDAVRTLTVLDIAPTREMYRGTDDVFARLYWHWFWLTLPAPHPERMIGADPDAFWRMKCGATWANGTPGLDLFAPEALAEYLACWTPETIHASCEDYRAAASIDIAHDDADPARVQTPILALWAERGAVARCFDPLALWRERAVDVRGRALPAGHYLAEEVPDLVAAETLTFLKDH